MSKVFLSHSSKDKQFVRRLTKDLEEAGIEIWLDEKELLVGDELNKSIEYGISGSMSLLRI